MGNITYINDNGEVVSKEEFDILWDKFQKDVSYAIMKRKIHNKKDFFLKDTLPNRTVNSSLSNLESGMREQYAKEHPQIRIISRTDKPTIKIISRTDNSEEESKITIHGR